MKKRSSFNWKWLVAALAVAGLLALGVLLDLQTLLREALNWISLLGPWGFVLFFVLYVVATVLFIPGLILTLGAGVIFGVIKGSILVSISSIAGATLAFLIGRYVARDWVASKIQGNDRFEAIDRSVAREGWKIVGLTRLSPVFPFNLLNYAFGLTQVSLKDYFLASWVGMAPVTVMYVYIGSLAGDLATLGAAERSRTPVEWALTIIGLIATVIVTIYITHIARKALEKRVKE